MADFFGRRARLKVGARLGLIPSRDLIAHICPSARTRNRSQSATIAVPHLIADYATNQAAKDHCARAVLWRFRSVRHLDLLGYGLLLTDLLSHGLIADFGRGNFTC